MPLQNAERASYSSFINHPVIDEAGIAAIMQYGSTSDDPCPCFCGCCERGGCCRQLPTRVVKEGENVARINLSYTAFGWTSNWGTGLSENPPPLLFDGRLDPHAFHHRMQQLRAIGQERDTCCGCCCLFTFASFLPCICCWACAKRNRQLQAWNAALLQWQQSFNTDLLRQHGMFVKTQSRCKITYDGKGNRFRNIERWIAFAMTPAAAQALELEPHLLGDIDGGCCGGLDDKFVVHP